MDIRKVKKLIELLEVSDVDEIEIREGEESVRLSRNRVNPAQAYMQPVVQLAQAAPMQAHTATAGVPAAALADEEDAHPDGHVVTSPMVGTFYRASAPGETPFVDKGRRVNVGDTLCIIEAMKILNQIESDVAGIVTDVLADDGQPVEYDQPMFVIDTGS